MSELEGSAPWFQRMDDVEVSPRRMEMRRLADAARLVIERLASNDAPHDVIERAAAHLEAAAEELAGHTVTRRGYEGFAESANSGDPHAFFDHSPLMGLANPLAAPLRPEFAEDHVVCRAVFGSAYEGPPGAVHGGYVAAAFDEVLGMAQSLGGAPGMTGTLSIRYRKPTPLHQELRFEGRLERVDGRKIFTRGECYAGDTLTAEAEGLFIRVDFAKIAELMDRRSKDDSGH